jgi:predicted RecB family nuclease
VRWLKPRRVRGHRAAAALSRLKRVCSSEEIETLFGPARSVDLFNDVVQKVTMWPTRDPSIKTLAKFLGFKWRDTNPSGAASIEWFDRWITTGDPTIKQRIVDYNQGDCVATLVLLDGIRGLSFGLGLGRLLMDGSVKSQEAV